MRLIRLKRPQTQVGTKFGIEKMDFGGTHGFLVRMNVAPFLRFTPKALDNKAQGRGASPRTLGGNRAIMITL